MMCPKCQSENVAISQNVYTKSQSRSLIWNLLMIFITGGLWIIWMLIRKKKEKVVKIKTAVCQQCGNSWNL